MKAGSQAISFAPGSHAITAQGGGAFAFAGMLHAGSILATPKGVQPLEAANADDLSERTLHALFDELAEAPGSIELLVIGTGAQLAMPPKATRSALKQAGLRFEAMATGAAVRVYNVMQAENRRVAAALIAAP